MTLRTAGMIWGFAALSQRIMGVNSEINLSRDACMAGIGCMFWPFSMTNINCTFVSLTPPTFEIMSFECCLHVGGCFAY